MGQEDLISGGIKQPSQPQPQKSGINWILIFGILILVAIIVIGIYFLTKFVGKSTEQVVETSNSQLDSAKDSMAATDFNSITTAITMYQNQNNKYPLASNYSDMASQLGNLMPVKIEPPSSAYTYKYCSSDGSDFKVEVSQSNSIPMTKGNDTCSPG